MSGKLQPLELKRALELVLSGSGVSESKDIAHGWANKAIRALEALRDNAHSNKLRSAAQKLAKSMLSDFSSVKVV